jgi:hypothetical protein
VPCNFHHPPTTHAPPSSDPLPPPPEDIREYLEATGLLPRLTAALEALALAGEADHLALAAGNAARPPAAISSSPEPAAAEAAAVDPYLVTRGVGPDGGCRFRAADWRPFNPFQFLAERLTENPAAEAAAADGAAAGEEAAAVKDDRAGCGEGESERGAGQQRPEAAAAACGRSGGARVTMRPS